MVNAAVVESLRASKAKLEADRHERGQEFGREWASGDDVYAPLERLAKLCDGDRFDCVFNPLDHLTVSERLYSWLFPAADDYRNGSELWGDDHEDLEQPAYIRGFAQGAMEIWNDVKGLI